MKKYNKYLVPEKNNKLDLYDIEIVSEYNGNPVDENAIVSKIIGTKETFHIFILPNYQEKWVRMGCDSNTDFAQQVTQLMMESGEAEHLIKQVYDRCFSKPDEPISVENGMPIFKSDFNRFLG
jgi:glutamine amidotransferase-like uncharacterized protein